eukprot:scaffold415629_cov15-Prasinocladus_malaysianus.AAC.2
MVVVSEDDGRAALGLARQCMRRTYLPLDEENADVGSGDAPSEMEPQSPRSPHASSSAPHEDIGASTTNHKADDEIEMSLCCEEPELSDTDRLQCAAIQHLDRMAGAGGHRGHNPNLTLEEEAELNSRDHADDDGDAERNHNSREFGNRLVATYDSSKAVKSIDPEWFMLLFPDMFFNATGGPPEKVSEDAWLQHLILRDGTAFQSPDFICAAADRKIRHGVNLSAFLQFKSSPTLFKK